MIKYPTLLVIDDVFAERENLRALAESLGFGVVTAIGGDHAYEMLDKYPQVCAIITDVKMRPIDGMEVLQHINRMGKQPKTLVHSSELTYRPRGGEECNLADWVTTYFGEFARFAKKTRELTAERAFLKEVLADRQ